jgi:hypothetical protein
MPAARVILAGFPGQREQAATAHLLARQRRRTDRLPGRRLLAAAAPLGIDRVSGLLRAARPTILAPGGGMALTGRC